MRVPLGIPPFGSRWSVIQRRESQVPRGLVASRIRLAGEDKDPSLGPNEPAFPIEVSPSDEVEPNDYMHLWLDDDTGADYMQVYESDIDQLPKSIPRDPQGNATGPAVEAPLMGLHAVRQANGTETTHEIRIVEVNILDENDREMTFWDWVDVVILSGQADPINPTRVCGPWLRHRFYTATCPMANNAYGYTTSLETSCG